MLYEIEAARGLLRSDGRLPVNLKFLVEGEEEVGSRPFRGPARAEADRLACDLVVVSDTGMLAPDVPSTMRGHARPGRLRRRRAHGTSDLHRACGAGRCPTRPGSPPGWRPASTTTTAGSRCRGSTTPCDPSPRPRRLARRPALRRGGVMAPAGVAVPRGRGGSTTLERIGVRPTAEVVGFTAATAAPGSRRSCRPRRVQGGPPAGARPGPERGGRLVRGLGARPPPARGRR